MAKNKFYSDYDRSTVITILICMTVIAVGCVLDLIWREAISIREKPGRLAYRSDASS